RADSTRSRSAPGRCPTRPPTDPVTAASQANGCRRGSCPLKPPVREQESSISELRSTWCPPGLFTFQPGLPGTKKSSSYYFISSRQPSHTEQPCAIAVTIRLVTAVVKTT